MQFWQQQLVYKQLQEIQRQQQLQQLDQGALQNNSVRQMSAAMKPVAMNQLPSIVSHMSNYACHNNLNGSLPRVTDNSQILGADNMNWVQPISSTLQNDSSGLMLTNDRDQAMQSIGFIHQQLDQSSIGLPISSHEGPMDKYAQNSEIANNCNYATTKASGSHVGEASDPYNIFQRNQHYAAQGSLKEETSVAMQNLQGKELYGHNSSQHLFSDASSASFQQPNVVQHGFQVQEIYNRQERGDCSGKFQEKQVELVGGACGIASLDPTEEKILFGSENDDNWGASLVGNPNSYQGNNYFGGFPSIQSGSWSALMQEAVQASNSERGIQEEWSGLDFQKIEQSTVGYSGKHLDNLRKPLPLLNNSDTGPGAFTASSFKQPFESADDGILIAQANDPYASFKTSSSDVDIKQLNQAHEQKQLTEGNLQAQVSKSNTLWADQACGQQVNSASSVQNLDGGRTDKRDVPFFGAQFSNRSSASYPMESAGVDNSNLTDRDDILWRFGGGPVNPNDRLQPAKPDISNSQMQNDVSFIGTYGSDMSSINLRLNSVISQQDTNSQQSVYGRVFPVNDLVDYKGNGSMGNNQNRLSSTAPTRESCLKDADERLKDIDDQSNEKDLVSGEGFISSNSKHSQHSNMENGTKESSTSYSYDPNPFVCGNQVSLKTLLAQPNLNHCLNENQISSLWMNGEPSFLTSHQAHFQDLPNLAFQGSKSEEQTYVRGQHVSDNKVEGAKGCTVRDNELYARDNIPVNAFNSFNGSTSLYSLNRNVRQASQNMLELHKVDQSSGSTAASTFEMPSPADLSYASRPNQPVDMQRFNSRPASPAQGEPRPAFVSCSQAINSGKTRQFHQQSRNIDQTWSTSMPLGQSLPHIETAQRENSSIKSGEKFKETLDSVEQLSSFSAAPFDSSYVELEQQQFTSGKNQELLQQPLCHVSGLEALDQTNTSGVVKNALIARQQHSSKDGGGTVAGQFTQAFPTPVGRLPDLRLAPFAGAPAPSSSKYYSVDTESSRKTIKFPQFGNSGAVLERKPGSHPLFHGMPQHGAFTKMFQNVRTSMPTQQCLASLQPHMFSPHVVQPIVSRGLHKQDDHESKKEKKSSENVSCFADLHNREEHTSKGNSLNSMHQEKVDSGPKTDAVYSVPSPVHSYQEIMDKDKHGQDSAFHSLAVHGLNPISPPKMEVEYSGCTSVLPDVQKQNYSLLHQMQLIKSVNSNPQKVLGQNLKVINPSSDVSNIDSKTGQRYIYGQGTGIKILPDNKAGGNSQSSSTADMKMLSFASKGNEEKNASMPSSEGQNGLHDQMNSLIKNSAASLIGGTDCIKNSPRMAPSWFAKYGTNNNGTLVAATSDSQWTSKPASHPYFSPKVSGGMNQSTVVNQMGVDSQIGNNGQSSYPEITTAPESSLRSLLPVILDHGTVQGSKKRKHAAVELVPWHKMVAQDRQTLRCISMTELDWAQAANRLTEKVGDDAEYIEGVSSIPASKRRLILTTKLMQQLLPSAPARLLNAKAASAYETTTFYVARAALADACSMVSSFVRDSLVDAEHDYRISEKLKISEGRASTFSKTVEEFIGRSRKLEHDFLRLDKRTSVLDVQLDFQELERMSIVNQLAKFHIRSNMGVLDSSSSSGTVNHRAFPETYVTTLSATGNIPEGAQCVSL